MKWNILRVVFIVLVTGILSLAIGNNLAQGQDVLDGYARTEEEIVNRLQPKGFSPTKGLDEIVDDEQNVIIDYSKLITEQPNTKALVLFDFDSAAIKPDSFPLLREYGNALQGALSTAVLVIAGHTDSAGSTEYNLGLSYRRAEAVRQFLVAMYNIDPQRLIITGYGESKPTASNDTIAGQALNRRVEFIRVQ